VFMAGNPETLVELKAVPPTPPRAQGKIGLVLFKTTQ